MKLTRRQEEFVSQLIDLTAELHGPIHYSMLAERIGVSPFTAYDMLRVLEDKGAVSSEYQLAEGKSGPGRAERLFCPAISLGAAPEKMNGGLNEAHLNKESLKKIVLQNIQDGDSPKVHAVRDLLAHIPEDGPGETDYCLMVLMVIGISLRRHGDHNSFVEALPMLLPEGRSNYQNHLAALAGFALGFLNHENVTRQEWIQPLFDHILKYQEFVRQMPPEESVYLAQTIRSLIEDLRGFHWSDNGMPDLTNL